MDRRVFLERLGMAACGLAVAPLGVRLAAQDAPLHSPLRHPERALATEASDRVYPSHPERSEGSGRAIPYLNSGFEFQFARLRYDSGDWDYNPKVCANVLDAVLQYTEIPVHQQEIVITADSQELQSFPFLFMTGHKLVRFSERERQGLVRYVESGGLLLSDDCNHDVNGLYSKSFEAEMHKAFSGPDVLAKIPNHHALYHAFFKFPDGPPQTTQELNGWGDDIVHDYLRGVECNGRLGVIYSNKDYGCEWDYDWRNKKYRAKDNTKFSVNLVVYAMT